jgi:hypothetical protein
MTIEKVANQDFEHALLKAFWRRILAKLTGKTNKLLPFDKVRTRFFFLWKGEHFIGLRQVPIDQIIGSSGRYRDFDRAFLPVQGRTRNRWVSIDIAHHQDILLPPVELYKMGEVYFVKDGNHRVSVARAWGQLYIDAYVTEIDIPVLLTPDSNLDELLVQQEQIMLVRETGLARLRPGALITFKLPDSRERLLEHIAVHRWFLGEQCGAEVPYEEAAASWYDNVYVPVIQILREQDILADFQDCGEGDLYLWIMEFQWYLRRAYREDVGKDRIPAGASEKSMKDEIGKRIADEFPHSPVRRLVDILKRATWIDEIILRQERAAFLRQTRLDEICSEASIETTIPGQYENLLEHIAVHRWYLGEQRGSEVPFEEAVTSWYNNVYTPLAQIIREQDIVDKFPGRTETDLYLWIIAHQWYLRQTYGDEIPIDQAAEQFAEDYPPRLAKKIAKAFKRVTGRKRD